MLFPEKLRIRENSRISGAGSSSGARAGVGAGRTMAPHTCPCRARLSRSPSSEHWVGDRQSWALAGVRTMKGPVLHLRKARHWSRCCEKGAGVQQSRRRQELRQLGKTREEGTVELEGLSLYWVERRGRRQ